MLMAGPRPYDLSKADRSRKGGSKMNATIFSRFISRKGRLPLRFTGGILALVLALGSVPLACGQQEAQPGSSRTTPIPASEFSRMVQEFSEEGGYFYSDNFTSNETSYLHIVGKLQEMGISGGAYLGVAPEQNFTYIAKIRPRIAFIVDIRRQALIHHLLYKAIFHLAKNRAQFLSWLFSKPLPERATVGANSSLEELLAYFSDAPGPREAFLANLAAIRKTMERDFQFPLSPSDEQTLEYVYNAFWQANLRISFRLGSPGFGGWWGGFPNLRDLLLATDLNGKTGNFLAQEEDYQFVRNLQRQNRVIPVVGDFAGTKALATVGDYLRRNQYTVSAFYVSNVEQFLFANEVFDSFVKNIRKLPISDKSVFVRSIRSGWDRHPAYVPGHRMTTLLGKIAVFLKDYEAGLYPDYWSLATTHYIAANEPSPVLVP